MSRPERENAEPPGGRRVQAQTGGWLACSGGLLLLDPSGNVCAYDEKFAQTFSVCSPLPVPDGIINRIFPPESTLRDLISSAAAGGFSQGDRLYRLVAPDSNAVFARLQFQKIDSWWVVGICLAEKDSQPPGMAFLADQLATRRNIAGYLHDTLSQHLVAMSLLLIRLQRDPAIGSLPDLIRAVALCETCSRDLRALNDSLIPALPPAGELNAEDAIAALQWYVEHLRDNAGVQVRFEAVRGRADSHYPLGGVLRTLLGGALQQWAEVAINHSLPGETLILLTRPAGGIALQFLSSQPVDPRIAAILSSSLLREGIRAAGGSLSAVRSHPGESACLAFPDVAAQMKQPYTEPGFHE